MKFYLTYRLVILCFFEMFKYAEDMNVLKLFSLKYHAVNVIKCE